MQLIAFPIYYSVIATCSLLLAAIVLFIRFPQGEQWKYARISKYLAFASFLLYGSPLFTAMDSRDSVLPMTFNYLSDSITYAAMLLVPVLLLKPLSKIRLKGFIIPLAALCLVVQGLFFVSHPIYHIGHTAAQQALALIALALIAWLVTLFVRATRRSENKSVCRVLCVFYNTILLILFFYQILLPVFPKLFAVIPYMNMLLILTSMTLTIWLFHYASRATFEEDLLLHGNPASSRREENEAGGEENSPMSPEEELRLKENLERWTAGKKFLEQDEGMEIVAAQLGTDIKSLRYYFRTRMPSDFRTWRISLRIEFAKGKLAEHPDISINQLSAQVGFATKSNFYHYFKKNTGMTPAEYKERLSGGLK